MRELDEQGLPEDPEAEMEWEHSIMPLVIPFYCGWQLLIPEQFAGWELVTMFDGYALMRRPWSPG